VNNGAFNGNGLSFFLSARLIAILADDEIKLEINIYDTSVKINSKKNGLTPP
jgi:hypothetical protein